MMTLLDREVIACFGFALPLELCCEANLSTLSNPPDPYPRLSCSHGYQGWPQGACRPSPQGAQKALRFCLQEIILRNMVSRFPKAHRLLKRGQFTRVRRCGRVAKGTFFVVCWADGETKHRRFGVTVSKRVSRRAVDRNRIKRLAREAYRTHPQYFPAAADVVLFAKAGRRPAGLGDVLHDIASLGLGEGVHR